MMFTDKNGKKYFKGNLHMHTTLSDGRKEPSEALGIYKNSGYDFVALTDHWVFGKDDEYDGMLVLSGCECNVGIPADGEMTYHILALGYENMPEVKKTDSPQTVIDGIHEAGGLACLAHPAWSLNPPEEIQALSGIDLTEIYNSVSDLPRNARPYSGVILDILALRGCFLPLAATDDTHFYESYDTCRSYIMVQAEECTKKAIMQAIRDRNYFSTRGPVIDVKYDGKKVTVDCSPVSSIVYFTDSPWNGHRSDVGDGLTHGEFVPLAHEHFVRVEATDSAGRCAWSQYIVL